MKTWAFLEPIPPEPHYIDAELEKLRLELNKAIEANGNKPTPPTATAATPAAKKAEAGTLEDFTLGRVGRTAAPTEVDPADFTPTVLASMKRGAAVDFESMRKDLLMRRRLLKEWYPARQAARTRAVDVAFAAYQKSQAEVVERLRSIGYVDWMPAPAVDIPCLVDDLVRKHPLVFLAACAHMDVRGILHDTSDYQWFVKSTERLEDEMRLMVSRVVA